VNFFAKQTNFVAHLDKLQKEKGKEKEKRGRGTRGAWAGRLGRPLQPTRTPGSALPGWAMLPLPGPALGHSARPLGRQGLAMLAPARWLAPRASRAIEAVASLARLAPAC
jgi:hypothetical protein